MQLHNRRIALVLIAILAIAMLIPSVGAFARGFGGGGFSRSSSFSSSRSSFSPRVSSTPRVSFTPRVSSTPRPISTPRPSLPPASAFKSNTTSRPSLPAASAFKSNTSKVSDVVAANSVSASKSALPGKGAFAASKAPIVSSDRSSNTAKSVDNKPRVSAVDQASANGAKMTGRNFKSAADAQKAFKAEQASKMQFKFASEPKVRPANVKEYVTIRGTRAYTHYDPVAHEYYYVDPYSHQRMMWDLNNALILSMLMHDSGYDRGYENGLMAAQAAPIHPVPVHQTHANHGISWIGWVLIACLVIFVGYMVLGNRRSL